MKNFPCKSLLALLIPLALCGCGDSSGDTPMQPAGTDIIQTYDFHIEGSPTTTPLTLPLQLTDANWGLKAGLCQQAGYDLSPYAGQNVTLVRFSLTETYHHPELPEFTNEPLYLWVIADEQTSVCGYLSVREGSALVPGLFPLGDLNIR